MCPYPNRANTDAQNIDKLSEWQRTVREYERISGTELDETVQTATFIDRTGATAVA